MKIGEVLFFAPGIRFNQVDLNGPGLPRQFQHRMAGFYLGPADRCAHDGFGFASGVLLVSCIDALARLRFGGGVGVRFRKFVVNELRSFSHGNLAQRFYEEFRNGLVHEARLKNGGQFSLEAQKTVQSIGGLLLVNPKHLGVEVRSALDSYVTLLENNSVERKKLAKRLSMDLAEDFHAAQS